MDISKKYGRDCKMSNTLIVPARLEKAAKELKDNMTILKGCSPEVKEVIDLAAKQRVLAVWMLGYGDNSALFVHPLCHYLSKDTHAYCLPDDIEIVPQLDACKWEREEDDFYGGAWRTDCANDYYIYEGTPEENKILFCPFCGRQIEEKVEK